MVHALGLLSLAALLVDVRRRDPALLGAATLWLCVVVAHALVWMDLLYYYVTLPFVFVGGFRFVDLAAGRLGRRAGAAFLLSAALFDHRHRGGHDSRGGRHGGGAGGVRARRAKFTRQDGLWQRR